MPMCLHPLRDSCHSKGNKRLGGDVKTTRVLCRVAFIEFDKLTSRVVKFLIGRDIKFTYFLSIARSDTSTYLWQSASFTTWKLCRKGKIRIYIVNMTSSNGNILRVTGHLWGESTGHRWIPLTTASGVELWCFLWSASANGWANNRDAGDLKHYSFHFDVALMLHGYVLSS